MELSRIWHCPRPKLAQSYLQLLGSGLVISTCIFAPRRTGKTVFLRRDLTPAAIAQGYSVAYADLWQTKLNPGIALIRGLEEALEAKTLGQRVLKGLRTPVKKLKGGAGLGSLKAELEVELSDPRREATEMALRIDELVSQLCERRPLLLLVDEAQELARNKSNELMATALRTAMTKHGDRVRVVFTGSSRSQLAHVFSDPEAPLYTVGSSVQDFPPLGRELVEFVAEKFEAATGGRTLDVDRAWQLFQKEFQHKPEPFLSAIVAMLMNPALTLEAACQHELEEDARRENHEATWLALEPLQRELALMLLGDPAMAPFSKASLAGLGERVGKKLLTSHVQHALRALADRNIGAKNGRDLFEFENPAFERWLSAQATTAVSSPKVAAKRGSASRKR